MHTLLELLLAAIPVVLLAALLRLVEAAQTRHAAEIARQIHLTDAVHARMGALLAPVVTKPRGRPWQVQVTAPLERPEVVNDLLAVVADEFASRDPRQPEAFEVVLSPREKPRRALVEGAGADRYPAEVDRHLRLRLEKLPAEVQTIDWKAQGRLCQR